MLQILTDNRLVKGHLSLLARDLGHEPVFHDNTASLLSKISTGSNTTAILLDIDFPNREEFNKTIQSAPAGIRIIAFQELGHGTHTATTTKPEGTDYFFLLPPNAERAKARLKMALRSSDLSDTTERGSTRPGFPTRRFTRTAAPFKPKNPFGGALSGTSTSRPPFTQSVRYLTAFSGVAKNLVTQMQEMKISSHLIILAGNDGCDFETAAREFNFQQNQDRTQLIYVDCEELTLDSLEKLEKTAAKTQQQTICYLGKSEGLNDDNIEAIKLFVEFLGNLRNPHLRLVIAHEYGSEEFLRHSVVQYIKEIHNVRPTLVIPDLSDRAEDIPVLTLNLLNVLRAAHPFLQIKNISQSAIEYLVEHRKEMSEAKLVRILRNSFALSQRTTLQIEDLKNYGEHDSATSHLVESMADETYFPSSQTA